MNCQNFQKYFQYSYDKRHLKPTSQEEVWNRPTLVSVLLSAAVERVGVSHMQDFFYIYLFAIVCRYDSFALVSDFYSNLFNGLQSYSFEYHYNALHCTAVTYCYIQSELLDLLSRLAKTGHRQFLGQDKETQREN